jgi:cytochrome b
MSALVKVWDPVVRVFHWGLVLSFVVAWLSADSSRTLHHWAGYAAGGLIASRLIWGMIGSHYARFGQFIRSPLTVLFYLGAILTGREKRYVGHNPAGAAMIIALVLTMSALAFTGWLSTTDAYWGVEWVEETHETLADLMPLLVLAHLFGILVASIRHRENLVGAMISGRKRPPADADIA